MNTQMASINRPPAQLVTLGLLTAVALLWGGTFISGRHLGNHVPPLLSAFLRFFIASAVLAVYLRISSATAPATPKLSSNQLLILLLLGFSGIFCYNLFFFYGLQTISASRASLIVAINPAVIALACTVLFKERLNTMKRTGIAACLAGSIFIILNKDPNLALSNKSVTLGDFLILGCVLSWVTYSIAARGLIKEIGPLRSVTYSIFVGTVLLFIGALASGQLNQSSLLSLRLSDLIHLFYLGAFGSALAYVWYYKGINELGPSTAGVFISLVPVFGVVLGHFLLAEKITASLIGGGLVVVCGVVLCNRS